MQNKELPSTNEKKDSDTYNEEYNSENTPDRVINGQPLSFKTGEVAAEVGEKDQTIRKYATEFAEFLSVDESRNPGEHRTFTKDDIEKLKYIQYLIRKKKLSLKQVKEFLSTPEGQAMSLLDENEERLKAFTEMFMEQLKSEISNLIKINVQQTIEELLPKTVNTAIKEGLKAPLDNLQLNLLDQGFELNTTIQKYVVATMEDNKEEISKMKKEINESIQIALTDKDQLTDSMKRVEENISKFRQNWQERHDEDAKKKGFFSRLFK